MHSIRIASNHKIIYFVVGMHDFIIIIITYTASNVDYLIRDIAFHIAFQDVLDGQLLILTRLGDSGICIVSDNWSRPIIACIIILGYICFIKFRQMSSF